MLHSLKSTQHFPIGRKAVWDFMSNPANLATITPEYMAFEVLTDESPKMYQGQIIEYKVSPLKGLRLHWVTEITHVREGVYFVDEQRFGPYSFWHHQHLLEDAPDGGTIMKDIVHYKIPLGPFGKIANKLFVKRQLSEIFNYRHAKLEKILG